jgi:hypothetical protein
MADGVGHPNGMYLLSTKLYNCFDMHSHCSGLIVGSKYLQDN